MKHKDLFEYLFDVAVKAADPKSAMARHLPPQPKGKLIILGAGKSSGTMARAFEELWQGPISGAVVVPHGHDVQCQHLEILYSRHPVPDGAGLVASARLLELANGAGPDDLVVALISGGGSSLLPSPPAGMTLEDEIAVNRALLASGAPITAMNRVRKFLSTIKGGQLALAAHPAKVLTLIVSDVPGDDPAMIASGPTVPDASTLQQAIEVVEAYQIALPEAVLDRLYSKDAELPLPDDARFEGNEVHIVASAATSLEAIVKAAKDKGIDAHILSEQVEGEAREVAKVHGAIAREVVRHNRPFKKPVLLISGGETTVTIDKAYGRGGRNSEFLLSLALEIEGVEGISAFAGDSDGIDGSEDNAGAFADGTSALRMRAAGVDPRQLLQGHDAWSAFAAVDDLFIPGPTGTNINDIRMILIE